MRIRHFDSARADDRAQGRGETAIDAGAVNAMGNGREIAYGRGPELMQLFGAPYSAPTLISMVGNGERPLRSDSARRPGTNVWDHHLAEGRITDCAPRNPGCFLRHWEMTGRAGFVLDLHGAVPTEQTGMIAGAKTAFLLMSGANAAFYRDYPVCRDLFMILMLRGDFGIAPLAGGFALSLTGRGDLIYVSGDSYEEALTRAAAAASLSCEEMLARTEEEEHTFNARRLERQAPLREHPLKADALEAAEDTAMLLRAQQDRQGGIQAGYNYHMAYVRDQFGDFRGLLALGCREEARAILRFYREIHARHGRIHNAQGMGVDGIFHVHENDETEITGYVVLQAIMMAEADGDFGFFSTLRPLITWALSAQMRNLHGNMLPFNGDETYIAGGLVPRTIMNHGSLEATMLFREGARQYLAVAARLGWTDEVIRALPEALRGVEASFARNFRRDGRYVTNSLTRLDGLTEPTGRHGVCLNGDYFGYLTRRGTGCYLCPGCAWAGKTVPPETREFALKSTMMMFPYIGSALIHASEIECAISEYLEIFRKTGQLPSLPGGNRCLGYDPGLLLYAAKSCGLEADDLLAHTLALRDETGAWSEYYRDNRPQNTRCRPWESAINIEAVIKYLTKQEEAPC